MDKVTSNNVACLTPGDDGVKEQTVYTHTTLHRRSILRTESSDSIVILEKEDLDSNMGPEDDESLVRVERVFFFETMNKQKNTTKKKMQNGL